MLPLRARLGRAPTRLRSTVPIRATARYYATPSATVAALDSTDRPASNAATATSPASTLEALRALEKLVQRYPLLADSHWPERIRHAADRLQRPDDRTARIAFVGDHWSGVTALVTAAFDEPLASNASVSLALASRHLDLSDSEVLLIKHGEIARAKANELALPSAWLQDHDAQVLEVIHGEQPPKQTSVDSLLLSDAVVLVLSSERSLSPSSTRSLLHELAGKPNFILALNISDASPSSASSPLRSLSHQLSTLLPSDRTPTHILPISTDQATSALEALQPTEVTDQAPSFERFQSTFVRSGVPQLKDELTRLISSVDRPALHHHTAAWTLSQAIETSAVQGAKVQDDLHQAETDIAALSFIVEEATSSVLASLGVDPTRGGLTVPEEEVQRSMMPLKEVLEGRLAWYTLPWRTDEIVAQIALTTSASFLIEFEHHLVFSTGRLESLSSSLSQRTNEMLQTKAFLPLPSSTVSTVLASLHSPIMLNQIEQAGTESTTLPTTTLIAPLHHRRNQITSPGGPAETLQRKAQALIVRASSLTTGSILAGVGLDLTGYAELATSAGVGLLGITVACLGVQRGWIKAKKRFENDVGERVRRGLEEDLGIAAKGLVDRSTYKARTAVALAQQMLSQKKREFERFRNALSEIDSKRREG